jgi:hypothetical protein
MLGSIKSSVVVMASLAVALIVSIGFNISLANRVENLESLPTYYKDDIPIIRRALKEISEDWEEDPERILESTVPIVMRSPQAVCVEFRLTTRAAGVSPVTCYPPGTRE